MITDNGRNAYADRERITYPGTFGVDLTAERNAFLHDLESPDFTELAEFESEANQRQVGGDHYQSGYQHWDWAPDLALNPFEYQISKYVMRARKKNGRQDVEKAQHFAQKYVELLSSDRIDPRDLVWREPFATKRIIATINMCVSNGCSPMEQAIIHQIVCRDRDPLNAAIVYFLIGELLKVME